MSDSNSQISACKPGKPYPGFPLFAHNNGKWAKKIRGRLVYFGRWDNPQGALEDYLAQRDALHSGRTPKDDSLTVKELGDRFLTEKSHAVDAGEIVRRTFEDYRVVAQFMADVFGKERAVVDLGPADFSRLKREIAKKWGVIRTGNTIQRTRTIFKWAYDVELIDKPIRFGPDFSRPTQRILRKHRAANGERMFEAGEIHCALDAASKPMRAMILLAINCGFGNSDCGQLPLQALDLDAGWITYPRPKTGVDRRCPLWPETIEAIRTVQAMGRKPKDPENAGLVFYTERGLLWHKELHPSPVSKEFRSLLKKIDRHAEKAAKKASTKPPPPIFVKGRGFYAIRHTHQTIAEEASESPDYAAIARIMGHAERSDDMAARYRERISDERLLRITNHIRAWLFPELDN